MRLPSVGLGSWLFKCANSLLLAVVGSVVCKLARNGGHLIRLALVVVYGFISLITEGLGGAHGDAGFLCKIVAHVVAILGDRRSLFVRVRESTGSSDCTEAAVPGIQYDDIDWRAHDQEQFCRDDDMSDTGLGSDAGPGYIETLLADIYQFEVSIKDSRFQCHTYPFPLKSSYFKAAIQTFKTSIASSRDNANLLINLSELPGGSRAFGLIRHFCYESSVRITKQNVLDLLSASKFLGFTEDMAPSNLYERCRRFVETKSTNGVQGILTMLAHSTANDSYVTDYEVLFNRLAEQALIFQDPRYDHENEIVGLLLELTKLKTGFMGATLQEFERRGVNMIDFFWCKKTSTNLRSVLGCCLPNGVSIFSYFVKTLDKWIDAGEISMDVVDPKKLVMVWTSEFLIEGPLLSENVMKAHVSSQMCRLKAEDIMGLRPQLIRELISTAVLASRQSPLMRDEIGHLAGLVDELLLLEAKRCPWDGSSDSKLHFQQMAQCIPLTERESHDTLYDAVASFSRLFTPAEATEIWNLIDTEKLSPT